MEKFKVPHTFVLLFFITCFAALLTWMIPAGEFERTQKKAGGMTKNVIVENSYKHVEPNPQTWQVFSAFMKGFEHKADIIVFIFIVGGAFMVINKSNAIDAGIHSFLNVTSSLNKFAVFDRLGTDKLLITLIMIVFSVFGAVFGMSEETIPFVLIFVPLAISMGYDSIVGVAMCFVAAGLGFAGAILNPFTIGVAQGIAELQPFSGLEYRLICYFVILTVGIIYVLNYAGKVKKNPKISPVYEEDAYWRAESAGETTAVEKVLGKRTISVYAFLLIVLIYFSMQYSTNKLTFGTSEFTFPFIPFITAIYAVLGALSLRKSGHFFVLTMLLTSILFIVIGVMSFGWYVMEIATVFFALGVFSGIAMKFDGNKIATTFLDGMMDIAGAAIVVALAGGIIEVLQDGRVIDTILYGISNSFGDLHPTISINLMLFFQTILNVFVPSGSGQAALTIPILAPLSDLIGVSRQATVMAFQFGDGFTNLITPTSGVLIGCLGMAKIPFSKWFRWMFRFQIILMITAAVLLIPTVLVSLNGF